MATAKRETERKYESHQSGLPDLTGVGGVAAVLDKGVVELDATYYDTPDERLAAGGVTLRRRTGGSDAGWHLKLPVAPGVRDELRTPLSDTVPDDLAALARSRARGAELVPVVRLRSVRDVRHLVDADGRLLAEASVDAVTAERLTGAGGLAQWTEIEVELADGTDPAFLEQVDKRLRKADVRPSRAPSKLARALRETAPARQPKGGKARRKAARPVTAGDHVLVYLRAQRDAIVALDPAVRRDVEDSVHQMRVATRRARSALRAYHALFDRAVTEPIGAELRWLAGALGVDRDREVLAERLTAGLAALPDNLVAGPVGDRLHAWSQARHDGSRPHLIGVLDSGRHLALLDALDALLTDPPLRKAAGQQPSKVIAKAVRNEVRRVSGLVELAIETPPGQDRDMAVHEARKRAKRTRYAAEAATPALGKPAAGLTKAMKSLTVLLGDHQDSVMARETLRELAAVAQAAGEPTFTYGLLHGREEQRAAQAEARLPGAWHRARSRAVV